MCLSIKKSSLFHPSLQLHNNVVVVVVIALELLLLTNVYVDVVFFFKRQHHHHDLTPLTSTKKTEAVQMSLYYYLTLLDSFKVACREIYVYLYIYIYIHIHIDISVSDLIAARQ